MRVKKLVTCVVLILAAWWVASLSAQVRGARRTAVVRGEEGRGAAVGPRGAVVAGEEGYAAVGRRGGVVVMGAAQTGPHQRWLRRLYVVAFLVVLFYAEVPWAGLLLDWLRA
jgi:hypothetical protein